MDPRAVGPQQRSANHSPLMLALGRASANERPNACPYGCDVTQLDERGYCYHLMGFTKATPQQCKTGRALMEPIKDRPSADGVSSHRYVDGSDKQPVLPTDHLERITDSYRVYRNVAKPKSVRDQQTGFMLPGPASDDPTEVNDFLVDETTGKAPVKPQSNVPDTNELSDEELEAMTSPVPSI